MGLNFIKRWILQRILKEVVPMTILKGYVTYISAVLMIVTGLLQLLGVGPDFMTTSLHGWELVMSGLTVFGVGRKLANLETK